MEGKGFDDQFNDGLLRSSMSLSRVVRPGKWPKSVSAMRQHTSYGSQGMREGYEGDHIRYRIQGQTWPIEEGNFYYNPTQRFPQPQTAPRNYIGCAPGPYGTCRSGPAPYAMFTPPPNPKNPAWVWRD